MARLADKQPVELVHCFAVLIDVPVDPDCCPQAVREVEAVRVAAPVVLVLLHHFALVACFGLFFY